MLTSSLTKFWRRRMSDQIVSQTEKAITLAVYLALMFSIVTVMALLWPVHAHEHQMNESAEQARVVDFYKTWKRPKGDFASSHRVGSCCYAAGDSQDCFPVLAIRHNDKGELEVMPDVTGTSTLA